MNGLQQVVCSDQGSAHILTELDSEMTKLAALSSRGGGWLFLLAVVMTQEGAIPTMVIKEELDTFSDKDSSPEGSGTVKSSAMSHNQEERVVKGSIVMLVDAVLVL